MNNAVCFNRLAFILCIRTLQHKRNVRMLIIMEIMSQHIPTAFKLSFILIFHHRASVLSDDAEQVFLRLGINVRVSIINPLQSRMIAQP